MKIIGTKFLGHDSACCLIDTKAKTIFATATERVTRIKHDWAPITFVARAYHRLCKKVDLLTHATETFTHPKIALLARSYHFGRALMRPHFVKDTAAPVSQKLRRFAVGALRKPHYAFAFLLIQLLMRTGSLLSFLRFPNLLQTIPKLMRKEGVEVKQVTTVDHHLAHAASTLPLDPHFNHEKVILTLDGEGDGYFSKLYHFKDGVFHEIAASACQSVKIDGESFAASVGIVYGNFTEALDLRRDSDEGKVEALAAYGKADPETLAALHDTYQLKDCAIVFDPQKLTPFYDQKQLRLLRNKLGDEHFAATIQTWLEELAVKLTKNIKARFPHLSVLYLAGGVAANVIMNLRIFEESGFDEVRIAPPMGDDGIALGAAILAAMDAGEDIRWLAKHTMPYFGHEISEDELQQAFRSFADRIQVAEPTPDWPERAAEEIVAGKVIAVVQGKAEFGPRALGNRSILANPTDPKVKDRINAEIKRRPWYQPFCPSVLEEERERLFEKSTPHKHMAIAFRVKSEYRDKIPSAMHIDGTARPQFVEEADNPAYFRLLQAVKKHTGFGVVINTSFNLHGRTMVRTANDALTDFIDCNLDTLYINGYRVTRK